MLAKYFRRNSHPPLSEPVDLVPVLCRISFNGGWRGSAVDLPVSASGQTIQETQGNLTKAIAAFLKNFHDPIQLSGELTRLQSVARECHIGIEEMSDCELFWRTTIRVPQAAGGVGSLPN